MTDQVEALSAALTEAAHEPSTGCNSPHLTLGEVLEALATLDAARQSPPLDETLRDRLLIRDDASGVFRPLTDGERARLAVKGEQDCPDCGQPMERGEWDAGPECENPDCPGLATLAAARAPLDSAHSQEWLDGYQDGWDDRAKMKSLEAARQSPPLDVETLAQIIREVDGNHDLGAAALAERILARLAVKGEQGSGEDARAILRGEPPA